MRPHRALAALLLLLGGCVDLAPRYARPSAPVPAAFPQGGAYAAQTDGARPASELRWRSFFVDPKLSGLITVALADNRDLRVTILNVALARQQLNLQRAQRFPTLRGQAGALYEHEPTSVALGSTGSGAALAGGSLPRGGFDFHEFTATLGVSDYELDLWGRVESLTRAALEQYLASKEARRAAEIALVSEVANADLAYAADQERLKAARDALASDEKILELTRARFADGVISELDVSQAETTTEAARSNVAQLSGQVAQDLDALNLLLGRPADPALLPDGLGAALPTLADAPAGLSSAVLLGRPDVLEAEHTLRSYNADIGAARAAFFPTVTLTGDAGGASLSLRRLFDAANGTWLFQPAVSLPIFDAGANAARLRIAKIQKDQAIAQYEKAVQTAFRDVADALAARGVVDAEVAANERAVAAAERALQLSLARYQRGVDPFVNTLNAELTLYGARQNLISARLARASSLVALYRALGGGTDTPPA